jgi:UDP-galactopyranose mutase
MMYITQSPAMPDLVCLSHLRWNFVFQRPQHLMSRFARDRRVFFVEEPVYSEEASDPCLDAKICPRTGVEVLTPRLAEELRLHSTQVVAALLSRFVTERKIQRPILWFYTPMAIDLVPEGISPAAVVYDCMDELSGFKGASSQLPMYEQRLMKLADLVFTGGVSLFEAKRTLHPHVHAFPSGVDVLHFSQARTIEEEPADQRDLKHPRLGFAGVVDERMDLGLIREAAEKRPEWQLIMLGPVVKIDPGSLPRLQNIHWLGMKDYQDLPRYFSGWDVGMMPFALNDATRYISPTKTPEYLAAGLPVVSTPIRDVVQPYGELGLAHIASNAEEFITEAENAMKHGMSLKWRERADEFLASLSLDSTWSAMNTLIQESLESRDWHDSAHPGTHGHAREVARV